jgi:hypothetical protein
VASTLNVAVCPAVTVWLPGCVVIDGATAAAWLTVRVALLLLTLPAELLMTTEKLEPLSVVVVAGVEYELEVAPVMFVPFFLH